MPTTRFSRLLADAAPVLALTLAFCSRGGSPDFTRPTADYPVPVDAAGGAGTSAVGDAKIGSGVLDMVRLRMDRQLPPGTSILRQYANPGGAYLFEPGETIELWAEWNFQQAPGLVPRFRVEWGDGGADIIHCGPCLLTHRYPVPGSFTVRASLDDRVSTTVTRTFTLRTELPTPSPSRTPSATAEIVLQPGPEDGKDAYAWSCGNAHDGSDVVIVGSPRSSCNQCNAKAYLQFDLSSLPAVISGAYLGFTHYAHDTYCYSNCSANFYFYPVLEAWSEATVGGGGMPSEGAAFFGPMPISFPNNFGSQEYDITEMYRNWKANSPANNGLVIYSPEGSCNNASVGFVVHSSEDPTPSNRPYLRVVYPRP